MRALRGLVPAVPVVLLALALAAGARPAGAQAPSWRELPGAPLTSRIDDLHFLNAQLGWIATGDGAIFRTDDGGTTWTPQLEDGTLYFRCIRFADAQHGFAGTLISSRLLYATSDGGATWSVANVPEPRPNALCGMSAPSSRVIYGVGSYSGPARMIKSVDGGANWATTDLSALAWTLVDVHFFDENEGLAVGSIGEFPGHSRSLVIRTTDGGANWHWVHLGTREGEWGWKIQFPTADTGYVSLERFNGPMFFLKTVNRGLTWTELPFANYNEQGVGFANGQVGWLGGRENPTFGTTDGGMTWTETPWGEYLNRFQFLGPNLGYGAGITVYKYSLPTDVVAAGPRPGTTSPTALPNPFGSRTTIRYDLAAASDVSLYVADPTGRLVRRLVRGPQDAGTHTLDWNGRDDAGRAVAAGIYLYVLHTGTKHEMGKLVRIP